MRRYMWPGGNLPSATAIVTAAHTAAQGRFTLDGVENHSARKSAFFHTPPYCLYSRPRVTDYPRTLRTWGKNMDAFLTPVVLGMKALPTCDASYEAKFNYDAMVRKWQYLFAYASAGFARGYITW